LLYKHIRYCCQRYTGWVLNMLGRDGPTGKLQAVELIRFLAAFSVILWHYQIFFFDGLVSSELLPLSGMLSIFYNSGFYAVEWFWVLSGYVFFFNYRDALASGSVTGFDFFCRRFARLYPLHFTTLLLVSVLLLLYRTFISQLLMASNWSSTDFTFNYPVWSVSVEVLIYVLFFILSKYVYIVDFTKTILVSLLCLVLFYIATREDSGTLPWIAECAACFYLGGCIYEARTRYSLDIAAGVRQILFWATLAGAVFTLYYFKPTYALKFFVPASAIMLLVCSEAIERSSIVGKLARVGNWTYSSYLLHFPVALLIVIGAQLMNLDIGAIARRPMFLVSYVVLVFILSDLSYTFFEAPARRALRLVARVKDRISVPYSSGASGV
jgi:peptidoglycan/LPS O-acetylase OafA/YrhL